MTDTVKLMWEQVEKARADGTFSTAREDSMMTKQSTLSPEDIWEAYMAETPADGRSPQGAVAFVFDAMIAENQALRALIEKAPAHLEWRANQYGGRLAQSIFNGAILAEELRENAKAIRAFSLSGEER